MERAFYSNPIPFKFYSNSPFFSQHTRLYLPRKLAPCFPESRPVSSISCNLHGSAFLSANCVETMLSSEDLPNGQDPKHDFLKKIIQKLSHQQKALRRDCWDGIIVMSMLGKQSTFGVWAVVRFKKIRVASLPPIQVLVNWQAKVLTSEVFNAGTVILLSAICLTLFHHPALVSPAFASFPSAASGESAAVAAGGSLIRSELVSSAWTGLLAGCLHTLSGPDHLAALAPLSIGRTRMESAAVGALWGCGHDAGQLIFGLLFLLLKDRLHIEVIRTWGTRVVGLTLLIIGAMGIREASEVPAPHVATDDAECDVSRHELLHNPPIGKKKIGFATFATGIVHGLQPDAMMMILPALALPSRLAGAAFLFMFLIGTVVAMGSYTVFIGSCSQALKDRVPRITEKLTWASSLVAIALGVAILVSQFFGFSLY